MKHALLSLFHKLNRIIRVDDLLRSIVFPQPKPFLYRSSAAKEDWVSVQRTIQYVAKAYSHGNDCITGVQIWLRKILTNLSIGQELSKRKLGHRQAGLEKTAGCGKTRFVETLNLWLLTFVTLKYGKIVTQWRILNFLWGSIIGLARSY